MENGGVNFDRCLLEKPFVHQQSFTFEKRRLRCLLPCPPVFFHSFPFSRRLSKPPFVTTCTPANRLMSTWLIISYYYPENQNKGTCRRRAHTGFLTLFWHVYTPNRAGPELLRKASRQRLCPHGCRLSRATCTPTHFASFPSPEAQDRLTRDRVCVCCPVLRSGHVTHKPPRPLLCMTFCSAESRKWLHRVLL